MGRTSTIDEHTVGAVREFVTRASRRFAVHRAVLFGSRARGDARPDSDADVALVLEPPSTAPVSTRLEMADIAYDVLLETGVHIQPLPMALEQWLDPDRHANPRLVRNIQREGVVM